jgi:hypothetical protein
LQLIITLYYQLKFYENTLSSSKLKKALIVRQLAKAIEESSISEVQEISYVSLAGNEPPWYRSDLQAQVGQTYTLLAAGKIQWSSRDPSLYGGPGFHLWSRVPGGQINNVVRNTGTFVADRTGSLELGIYFGTWANAQGDLQTESGNYRALSGSLEVIVILWKDNVINGLKKLTTACNSTLLSEALAQSQCPVITPLGWEYLKDTGISDIYSSNVQDNNKCISLNAKDDQGILRKPIEFNVFPSTQLQWDWKLLEHPSQNKEDEARYHDYISVAAEFDNGRDLTWIWSSQLDVDHYFDCPIKSWSDRETHYVIRKGTEQKNEWLRESRNLYTDVGKSMKFTPHRVTAIWLIGVATFQHASARAEFSNIKLINENETIQVL